MRSCVVCAVIGVVAVGCATAPPPPPPPPPPEIADTAGDMPPDVRALLASRCAGCHLKGPRDRGGWGSVLDLPRMIEARIIVPGDPHASSLIGQLTVGEMPKRGPKLRAHELELLERWIRGLAPFALAR